MSNIRPIENQVPAMALGSTALLFGLMAWRMKAPTLTVAAVDPTRYPWWHSAVYAGAAGVLLLLALVVFWRGRTLPVTPTGAEVWVAGDLPWVAGWLVGVLFQFMVVMLGVGDLARSAAYRMREGTITTSLIMAGLGLPIALLVTVWRRRLMVDVNARSIMVEWGKPFVFRRKTWGFDAVKGLRLQKVLRRQIVVYRLYIDLQNGKRLLVMHGVPLHLAQRDARLLSKACGWSIEAEAG